MKVKKGNKGNNYLNSILEKLGPDYFSNDEDIKTNNEHLFKIIHKICGKEFETCWRNVSMEGKCPHCYSHGQEVSDEYFKKYISEMYDGEFIFKKQEVRNKKHRFFFLEHKSCNSEFWISYLSFKKKKPRCIKCDRFNTESFKKAVFDKYGDEYTVLGEYVALNKPIKIKHNKCGAIIETLRPNNLLYMNQGCKACGMKMAGDHMKAKRAPQFYKEIQEKFGDRFTFYSEYDGYWGKITGYDSLLDKVFCKKPSDIMKTSVVPNKSIAEQRISEWLKRHQIPFKEQYSFEDLKDKKCLKFDFFLEEKNLLIEFDGEQHFKQRRDDPTGEKLKITQEHDKMKNEYCQENNIELFRISYLDFKHIERKLSEYIYPQGS